MGWSLQKEIIKTATMKTPFGSYWLSPVTVGVTSSLWRPHAQLFLIVGSVVIFLLLRPCPKGRHLSYIFISLWAILSTLIESNTTSTSPYKYLSQCTCHVVIRACPWSRYMDIIILSIFIEYFTINKQNLYCEILIIFGNMKI